MVMPSKASAPWAVRCDETLLVVPVCEQVPVRTRVTLCAGEKSAGEVSNPLPPPPATFTASPAPFLRPDGKITLSALSPTFCEAPLSHFLPPSHCFPHPGPPSTRSSGTSKRWAGLSHLGPALPPRGRWYPRDLTRRPSQPLGPGEPSSPRLINSCKGAL